MKILLIGGQGQVGWELQRTLAPLGTVYAPARTELDLADADALRQAVRQAGPDLIVNAAAYTAVDQAERERDLAFRINGDAPGILAEEARRIDAAIVHYSTDYVFDGAKGAPYEEIDAPRPLNAYGESKLAGERAVAASGAAHLILRTSWVYGVRGKNFLLTMRRLGQERDELRVVDDQVGAPTWSRLIAEATASVLAHCLHKGSVAPVLAERGGLYHLSCAGQVSWHGFARAIVATLPKPPRVTPIATQDYPTPAARPAYSVLSNGKLARAFGLVLPDWRRALALCLEDMTPGA